MATIYLRGKTYWVRFQSNGKLIRRSAHTAKKSEALTYLQSLLAEQAAQDRGDCPRVAYEIAAERFLREAAIRPKTRACYATSDRMCRKVLGGRYIDEINRSLLSALVAARKESGVSDASIRRDLAYLSSLCSAAMAWGLLNTNPVTAFSGKRRLRELRPRTRFLDQSEYNALLSVASERLRSAIVLAVETGMRKEELFSLKLSDIDRRRREIVLDHTKTGAPRRVPLSDAAIAEIDLILLGKQRHRGVTYLFCHADGSRVKDFKKAFQTACRRAAISNMHWHDLRHTFASWYLQAGGDMYALSCILGHTSLQMTARYGHLRTDDLHRAIQSVTQKRSQDHLIATGTAQDADVTI